MHILNPTPSTPPRPPPTPKKKKRLRLATYVGWELRGEVLELGEGRADLQLGRGVEEDREQRLGRAGVADDLQ